MSSPKHQQPKNSAQVPPRSLKRALLLTGIGTGIILLVFYFMFRKDASSTTFPVDSSIKTEIQSIKTNAPEINSLIGRWLRPDGGYILEIRSATSDGKLDVGYYNPKSINVGRAEWVEKDGKLYVMAELQDVNYPGSTYGLEYQPSSDHMVGTYYQAVEKSTYEVEFVREK